MHPNIFTGNTLDRADTLRRDAPAIDTLLHHPATRFIPIWRGRVLLEGTHLRPLAPDLALPHLATAPWALLGLDTAGTASFALDLSHRDTPLPPATPGNFEDLRRAAPVLPADEAAILAHARALMHWRTRARFCPVCGAACQPQSAGHVMACTGCGTHHFPRTDAAVIMLVTHTDGGEERALLGVPARFRDSRMMTTLAGFVEPGESLEEAVAREVCEEAGIKVGDVTYHASQPWPFPASLMVGFSARARTTEITIDPEEITEAAWFTRAQLRAPDGFALPPPLSIARRLIDHWLES